MCRKAERVPIARKEKRSVSAMGNTAGTIFHACTWNITQEEFTQSSHETRTMLQGPCCIFAFDEIHSQYLESVRIHAINKSSSEAKP